LSRHRLPPPGAKGLAVLAHAHDGRPGMGIFHFTERGTGCQRSGDGDLVVTSRPRKGARRVVANFPAGDWAMAAWVLGEEADGLLRVQEIEQVPLPPTGDPAAVEAASTIDREWFAAHPDEASRYRDALPGEWTVAGLDKPPVPGAVLVVEVSQLRPGVRVRVPAFWAFAGKPLLEDPR
jgi:hypothetical protein